MRRVTYVTGTRADFGLMRRTLLAIDAHAALDLNLVVTGMHLSARYGATIGDVEATGLRIGASLPVEVDRDDHGAMAIAAGTFAAAVARHLAGHRPDILLLLGDRWEMLGAAMAGTLLNIPIAHACGGERSGTVDDAMRHAISRLAHIHLAATPDAGLRLARSGEEESRIHVVGSPGLAGIRQDATTTRVELAARFGFDAARPLAVILFHPVVQDAADAVWQVEAVLTGIRSAAPELQALCLLPNADAGNDAIRTAMLDFRARTDGVATAAHVPRDGYLSLLAHGDVLVGNSSSGIIEAASFGLPVVNVGDRQAGRERNSNTVDVAADRDAVAGAVAAALARGRQAPDNLYGDGRTDERIAAILSELPLDRALIKKGMTF